MRTVHYTRQQFENPNLKLHYEPQYRGLSVLARPDQPLITQYLDGILDTIDNTLHHYPRLTALVFVLKLPVGYPLGKTGNSLMTRFWRSLKAKIRADRGRAHKQLELAHDTDAFYVWAREYNAGETAPHWHCALLVNQDAYYGMGSIHSNVNNMYHRIASAWSSALGPDVSNVRGLVHLPDNLAYRVNLKSEGHDRAALFCRLSYLAKAPTKVYQNSVHAFGCSRARRLGSVSRWASA